MRFKFLILGLIILWHCNKILTQCYLQQLLTTKNNGVQLQTTTIDLREEILGFLSLTELLKQEKFLVRDNMIITRPGDETCVFLGEGYRLHDIQTTVNNTLHLPVLTQASILSKTRILLTTWELATIVSKDEFSELINILNFEDRVEMSGHHKIVFILQGSRKILTNFNVKDTNTCKVSSTVINLNHRLSRLVTEMEVVWKQLQKANLLFGQIVDLDSFSGCLHETDVSFGTLMIIPQDDLAFCKKGLMVHKRQIRSIS